MTRRHKLEQRRRTLGEIRGIMNSTKTLAYMETHKLGRFLDAQRAVVAHIETVATDFLSYYAKILPQLNGCAQVYLLLGSERGFCGDFNGALLTWLESHAHENDIKSPLLIAAGRKLAARLEKDPRVVALIDGATVVEEVETILNHIVNAVSELQAQYGTVSLRVVYHDPDKAQIVIEDVLPPFERYRNITPHFPDPPLINIPPQAFLADLIDHYLFAALHEIMYLSLMAENLQRVQHLEGVVQHLDEKSEALLRKCNALRQEEIIEEIEVILLNTMGLDTFTPGKQRR